MRRATLCLIALCLCSPFGARAQRVGNWRAYRSPDGLPESACVSVTLSAQGKLIAKHPNVGLISEFDGYTVSTIPVPDSPCGRIYESPGGQLWTVVPRGLSEFKEDNWVVHPLPEIAAELRRMAAESNSFLPLCPIRQGQVLFLLSDRLMLFSSEQGVPTVVPLRSAGQKPLGNFIGLELGRDGSVWLSASHGLSKSMATLRNVRAETEWHDYMVPPELEVQNLQSPREGEGAVIAALAESVTNHASVLVLFDGEHWKTRRSENEKLRQAWCGPDQTCWATTGDALLLSPADRQDWVENEEVAARQYFDVAVEPSGAFWMATSDGLYRYASLTWRPPLGVQLPNASIHSLAAAENGGLWFIAGNTLQRLGDQRSQSFPQNAALSRALQTARAIYPLKNSSLVLETAEGLFELQQSSLRAFNSGGRQCRPIGLVKPGVLCLRCTGSTAPEASNLQIYDGEAFQPFPYPAPETSIGSNYTAVFVAQNGDVWVSGELGSACFHDQKWRNFVSTDKASPAEGIGFVELADGKIWCAASDRIWEYDGRNWSSVRRGFARINGMVRSRRDGSVWVASNSGLFRYAQPGAWVENGVEEGLPSSSIRALCEDSSGRLWAGTSQGLSVYYPEADTDAPRTHIEPLAQNEKKLLEGRPVSVMFSGVDKWKYTTRPHLLYSYRLDDGDWSLYQESSSVTFPDLPAGKHYFQVRAMDRNGNVDPKPALLEFAIALPWYKERRLVMISFAGAATALFFGGLAFNRHRRLLRSYAEVERKVTERTRELEITSRELLHSQKMNALGSLAAGIAHDFNNILSIIKGSAQIIEDNLDNQDKVRTRLDRIKTVVEQGSGIVKAMLGFSRDSSQETGACDVNTAVEHTIKLLGDRFLREVQVSFEPGSDLPAVYCSKDFIQQVLLNFIFNAAESMSKKKQVIISTRLLEKAPRGRPPGVSPLDSGVAAGLDSPALVLAPASATRYLSITVKDFGCGIPTQNLPRIFEPFFTTKALSARRGTGLGLSMAYELAKKMEAGLTVESVVEEGSSFSIILPVRPSATGEPKDSAEAAKANG
ncbi:MAG TPA: ATP-binding protein [Candidatus Dormibacteraeota bacterium]|nr:ATP-binding protein [Candidatus Dormibacteraeota bacterium]